MQADWRRLGADQKEVDSMRTTVVILGFLAAAGCRCPSPGDDSEVSYYLDVDAYEVSSEELKEGQTEEGPFYRVDVTILRVGSGGSAQTIARPVIVSERGKKSCLVFGEGRGIEGQPDLPPNGLRVEAIVGGAGQPVQAVVNATITESGSRIWEKTVAVPVIGP